MKASLSFGGRDVANGPQDSPVVEPIDPFQGGVFNGLEGPPWLTFMDYCGPVEAVDGFDGIGEVHQLVPYVAGGIDDVDVGLEHPVRKPVGAQVLPDVFDGVQFRRDAGAGR